MSKLGVLKLTTLSADSSVNDILLAGIYINEAKDDVMMINNKADNSYYYGQFVGSPKLMKVKEQDQWLIQLSTSQVNIERIDKHRVSVSNQQKTTKYKRINQEMSKPILAMPQQRYTNPIIGEIEFTYAKNGQINFIDSVGIMPLQCSVEHYCWSEEGDVLVNVINEQNIIVSTIDLKNLFFTKSAEQRPNAEE